MATTIPATVRGSCNLECLRIWGLTPVLTPLWKTPLWKLLVVGLLAGCAARAVPGRAPAGELLILVAFDGFRWDYDRRVPTPTLQRLAATGVRAEGLIPSYPSKTIPNMYTLATGLHPGHHGMIANTITDPATGRTFERSRRADVEDPMWWGGDPVWNVIQRTGRKAASMFWTGSEALVGGMRPAYTREFDDTVPGTARVDQLLAWLDLPTADRPAFLAVYLNDADRAGHFYGPDSPQLRAGVMAVDAQLGRLVAGLEQRGLLAQTNVVVVADHGMAEARQERTIVVDDFLQPSDGDITDINPTLGVAPRPGREEAVYASLSTAHPHLRMYRRADTPEHWHFRSQPRVPAVTGVADEGWVVIRRSDVATYWQRSPIGGQHGYDPRLESMRGIFVASGPAFRVGARVPAFESVHVHHIVAMAMGAPPAANDGNPAVAQRVLRKR
jgi:predicted AlkP superfamily pyrophosphatase or phosphodiesterase